MEQVEEVTPVAPLFRGLTLAVTAPAKALLTTFFAQRRTVKEEA